MSQMLKVTIYVLHSVCSKVSWGNMDICTVRVPISIPNISIEIYVLRLQPSLIRLDIVSA
jgi:hypothetical protein